MKISARGGQCVAAAMVLGSLAGVAMATAAGHRTPLLTSELGVPRDPGIADPMDVFAEVNDLAITDCAVAPKARLSAPDLALRLQGAGLLSPAVLEAWTCGGGSTPFVRFVGHPAVVVSYESGWQGVDVEAKWAGMIRDRAPGAAVVDVSGVHALLDPAVTEDGRSQVMVVVGDTLIRVSGKSDVPTQELLATARELNLN